MISKREKRKILSLHTKKGRQKWNLFIGEGSRWLKTAYELGHRPIKIFVSQNFRRSAFWETYLVGEEERICIISDQEFQEISTTQHPEGVLGIFPFQKTWFSDFISQKKEIFPLIVLNEVQDPGNLGTLIRTAFCFDFPTILLDPLTADPFQPKAARASLGTLLGVNLVFSKDLQKDLEKLLSLGGVLYLTNPCQGKAVDSIEREPKGILLFGNEGRGIEKNLFSLPHSSLHIPMSPKAESLNITASAAIILFCFARKSKLI
ncbi:MAG: RNA methyltransferase [Planctomycetota bacterium]|nr:MAG: RNA methyltransferase [Planctomycetota bacterium]